MRILVISDSHGRNDDILGVIHQVGHIDMLIHCGDVERGDNYIRSIVDCPVYMVSGNSDYDLDLPAEEVIDVGDYRIFVTHGHRHYVNRDGAYLVKCAQKLGANVVMFGHTHRPFIYIGDDITVLNPGSISYPRQPDPKPTFLVMEIDEYGEAHYGHGYYRSKFSELKI